MRDGNNDSFYYLFDQQASTRQVLYDSADIADDLSIGHLGEKEFESGYNREQASVSGEGGAVY